MEEQMLYSFAFLGILSCVLLSPVLAILMAVVLAGVLMLLMTYDTLREELLQTIEESLASDKAGAVTLILGCLTSAIIIMGFPAEVFLCAVAVLVAYATVCFVDMSRTSLSPACLIVWAVLRKPGATINGMRFAGMLGVLAWVFVLQILSSMQGSGRGDNRRRHSNYGRDNSQGDLGMFPAVFLVTVLGAWIGPVCAAYLEAWTANSSSSSVDFWDAVYKALSQPTPMHISVKELRYSSKHILSRTQDRLVVQAPRNNYLIRAVFHHGFLFALDNYALYSACFNDVEEIPVYIVNKPKGFSRVVGSLGSGDRFSSWFDIEVVYEESPGLAQLQLDASTLERFRPMTGRIPWALRAEATSAMHPQAGPAREAVRVPAEAFTQREDLPRGSVVLVVDRLVKFGERLVDLIRERHPRLGVEDPPQGRRSDASVRVPLGHEATVREAIKALGRERGKRSINIKAVPGTLVFDSPRE